VDVSRHPVWNSPQTAAALAAGDLGTVVRLVRRAHAMTQTELGNLLHVSASTISRLETGRQPLTNTSILKLLAEHLSIPPHILGLAPEPPRNAVITTTAAPATVPAVSVGSDGGESGDEAVRRRQLLADLVAAAGASAVAPSLLTAQAARAAGTGDPGALLVARVEDVLIGPRLDAAPVTLPVLRGALSSVVADFQACRYARLADQLPRLVAAAEATHEHATGVDRQYAAAVLAQTYNVTTRMLIKLDQTHVAWISGDRARTAATTGGNALSFAEATRNLCILTRTAGRHERARDLAIDAAQHLDITGGPSQVDPRHLSQHGLLYSTAGYSAAKTGDRAESKQLLDEAAAAASRLTSDTGNHWMGFGASGVRLYRISSALVLGDAGTAIDHARHVRPAELPTVERRARYWVDIARAFAMWGKYRDCYRALLAAEQAAPEETRSLPVVRTLVQTLATSTHRSAAPGLREFAARVHAVV
jgi:transcriptional regulator with XRE-family HTH domain